MATDDGLVVKLRRSKSDPEGKGRDVGIPYGSTPATCPVRALTAWKTAASISEGALFRRCRSPWTCRAVPAAQGLRGLGGQARRRSGRP